MPLMNISVEDHRFIGESTTTSNELVNITSTEVNTGDDKLEENSLITTNSENIRKQGNEAQLNFTVPYLSPIVLRKELESVFENSGDNCPASSRFVDEHPIIFWNLLWYFRRINVPTHLAMLCLNSASILNGKEVPPEWVGTDKVLVRILRDDEISS